MTRNRLNFLAGCQTTAMGIMPHTDVRRALGLALSLDVPFWPQLPKFSFYEDMYVQASQNFPGIVVDLGSEKISFNTTKFEEELGDYSQRMAEPETYLLNRAYSAVYHAFLAEDLRDYPAVRGQVTGPVSFGFKVTDENLRPIIFNEGVKALLFDFIQRKANAQYRQLNEKNQNAFVWLDEPGLGWVFSGLSGYNDVQVREDYQDFMTGFNGPRALHLCANVNLPYLLDLGIELLSFDAYQIELMPKGYTEAVAEFIRSGGVISWGIVPTDLPSLSKETPETLARLLSGYWEVVSQNTSLSVREIAERALIAPARCSLKNIEQVDGGGKSLSVTTENPGLTVEEQLVEKVFIYLGEISKILKNSFGL